MNKGTEAYQRDNLCVVVADFIKEQILTGRYKAGDHVLEQEIAGTLGISRSPVREGIKELEKEGIVTVTPRKGTCITSFTTKDIKEVFDIRILHENDIFRILIEEDRLTGADFETLETMVANMIAVVESQRDEVAKAVLINQMDMEFHRYIWGKTDSKRRMNILQGIYFQLRIAMLYDTDKTGDLMLTATSHLKIVEALRMKDLEACKKALVDHIVSYREGKFTESA